MRHSRMAVPFIDSLDSPAQCFFQRAELVSLAHYDSIKPEKQWKNRLSTEVPASSCRINLLCVTSEQVLRYITHYAYFIKMG